MRRKKVYPTERQPHSLDGHRYPGVPFEASTFREGERWRWEIVTLTATYLDGGNYPSRERAVDGLRAALGQGREP